MHANTTTNSNNNNNTAAATVVSVPYIQYFRIAPVRVQINYRARQADVAGLVLRGNHAQILNLTSLQVSHLVVVCLLSPLFTFLFIWLCF